MRSRKKKVSGRRSLLAGALAFMLACGAVRNPGQVLGAVRTGDRSAMLLCGAIAALAAMFLAFWAAFFKKLRSKFNKI